MACRYADAGMLRDITAELEGEWYNSFSTQAAIDLFNKDGVYYGVFWQWGMVGMFYNKDLFEAAGLDPEMPPATVPESRCHFEGIWHNPDTVTG